MIKNIYGKYAFVAILILCLALPILGLNGCGGKPANTTESADPIMELVNRSSFFDKAPEKLLFGKAIQDTDSDQGVTVKYLTSFFDGEATYIFFDLTDTGADLFSKGGEGNDFSLDKYDFLEKTGYNDSRLYNLISYDEKTKTATICVEYIGPLQIENLSFHIYSMTGNQKTINNELNDVDLYEMLKRSAGEFEPETEFTGSGTGFGYFDEKTGESRNIEMPEFEEGYGPEAYRLKKDVISVPLTDTEGNHAADITNIGWRNGWLHVQVKPENDLEWKSTNFNLKDNKTGELIYSPYNLAFGSVQGEEELGDYFEYVFFVGDLTKENLDCTITFINSTYRATTLKGDWDLKFSIPESLLKKLEADKGVPVNGGELMIRRAVISPVNISLFASAKDIPDAQLKWFDNIQNNALRMKIVYQDGKTAQVPEVSTNMLRNQKGLLFRTIYNPENFDEISGVEINGVLFSAAESLNAGSLEFDQLLYLSPLSSMTFGYAENMMKGTKYTISDDLFQIDYPNQDTFMIRQPVYIKETMTDEMIRAFENSTMETVSISEYTEKYRYTIYTSDNQKTNYRLYALDDELWLSSYADNTADKSEIVMDLWKLK